MRTMNKRKLRRKRVFILGAGVSASSGIAVAQTILRESLSVLSSTDWNKVKKVHNLISYLYPGFDPDLKNYPNIEDFLNLTEMAKTFNSEEFIESSLWPDSRIKEVQDITMKAVTDYLWSKIIDRPSSSPLNYFATEYLRYTDTVITFNWDVTLEKAIDDRKGAFTIQNTYRRKRTNPKHFVVLKPHGSIDWYEKTELPRTVKDALKLDSKHVVYPYWDFAEHPEVKDSQPLIVPPVATKEFSVDFLKKTWRGIYRAVSDATDLFVIGYSLPKEDQFARLVLRRAIQANVQKHRRGEKLPLTMSVVNPDDSVAVTFARMAALQFGVKFYQARFEDFASWLRQSE